MRRIIKPGIERNGEWDSEEWSNKVQEVPKRRRRRSMLDAKTDGHADGGPVVGFIGGRRTGLTGGSAATRETGTSSVGGRN